MEHFGEGRFIINFRIAVDKLDISGGYKRISFLLDFVTMSVILYLRLGILGEIFSLPIEIVLANPADFCFCQANIFLFVYVAIPCAQVNNQNLTRSVTQLSAMPGATFLVVV